MNLQRGRSNVTIIAVIVILVVIVAAAIPWWRSHQTVSHVQTALKAADGAKVAVMEAAAVQGGASHIKASELGYSHAVADNPYVAHIEIADGGRITISTKGTGAEPDLQLVLTPVQNNGDDQSAINWTCSVSVGNADAAPENCRSEARPAIPASVAPAATATVSPAHSS
jgi:type IV pilus assembly protein PilA